MDDEQLVEDDSDTEQVNVDHKSNIKRRQSFLKGEEKKKILSFQDEPKKGKAKKQLGDKKCRAEVAKERTTRQVTRKATTKSSIWLWIIIGVTMVFFMYLTRDFMADMLNRLGGNNLETNKEDQAHRTLQHLKSKFENQETSLWQNIFTSITMLIRDPTKPSIIVLVSNKSQTLDCLVKSLRSLSDVLNTGNLLLGPEDFDSNMGAVIASMKSKVKYNKTIIIWDLLNINIEALKAFHNLCDTINPLEEGVFYIIAIIAENYRSEIRPIDFVEKELWKKLSGKIKEDTIQPLITRITDGPILSVNSEPTIMDCS